MKKLIGILMAISAILTLSQCSEPGCCLFDVNFYKGENDPAIIPGEGNKFTEDGLLLCNPGEVAQLDKYYALAERMVRYRVKPSSDAVILFRSSLGDFNAVLDVPAKRAYLRTNPELGTSVPFLEGDKEYDVEIYHIYNKAIVKIIKGNETAEISAVNDGQGGCNRGKLQDGFSVGMQWDRYWFALESGTSALIKRITVRSLKDDVNMLIYGDSITQPEGYFPAADYKDAWTQRIITAMDGNAMSSGRGGETINGVLEFIKNELPYIKCKYVMVTIGTNGGNTEENLTELMEYIQSQGRIPILNNIPCNESGTQVACNELIAKVREKMGLKGCLFDLATSVNGDGQEVDKSMMFFEDLEKELNWLVWHHPNGKGGEKMYERTLLDIPEIYN